MLSKVFIFLLPDLDSNQDNQNQNLRYYRYTIGQLRHKCSIKFYFSNFL